MKNYFGNGKQARGSETIEITLNVDELLNLIHSNSFEFNGRCYLKAVVAKRRQTGDHGHTHTVYVHERERTYNERLIDAQEGGIGDP